MPGSPSDWADRAPQELHQAFPEAAQREAESSDAQQWPPRLAPIDSRGVSGATPWQPDGAGRSANLDRSDDSSHARTNAGIKESANHMRPSQEESMFELLDFNHPSHQWTCSAKKLPRRVEETVAHSPEAVPVFGMKTPEGSMDMALPESYMPRGSMINKRRHPHVPPDRHRPECFI
eukprot:2732681-Amphidinium_carterae.1